MFEIITKPLCVFYPCPLKAPICSCSFGLVRSTATPPATHNAMLVDSHGMPVTFCHDVPMSGMRGLCQLVLAPGLDWLRKLLLRRTHYCSTSRRSKTPAKPPRSTCETPAKHWRKPREAPAKRARRQGRDTAVGRLHGGQRGMQRSSYGCTRHCMQPSGASSATQCH